MKTKRVRRNMEVSNKSSKGKLVASGVLPFVFLVTY